MIVNQPHPNILFYFRQEIVHVEEEKRKLLVIGSNLCEDEIEREKKKFSFSSYTYMYNPIGRKKRTNELFFLSCR